MAPIEAAHDPRGLIARDPKSRTGEIDPDRRVLTQSPDYEVWLDRQSPRTLLDAAATPRSEAVAVEIMEALLGARLHRCVPLPDVMIASLAVAGHLTVLHHDRDFDRINQVYGEPAVEWLAL